MKEGKEKEELRKLNMGMEKIAMGELERWKKQRNGEGDGKSYGERKKQSWERKQRQLFEKKGRMKTGEGFWTRRQKKW